MDFSQSLYAEDRRTWRYGVGRPFKLQVKRMLWKRAAKDLCVKFLFLEGWETRPKNWYEKNEKDR